MAAGRRVESQMVCENTEQTGALHTNCESVHKYKNGS